MEQTEITLAEALLRRKELQQQLDRLGPIRAEGLFVTRVKRVNVMDQVDELTAHVPVVTAERVDALYNYTARQLRLVDAAIQRANWMTMLEIPGSVMTDFKEDKVKDEHPDAFPKS